MDATELLKSLEELQVKKALLSMDRQARIEKVITPKIKAQLEAIEFEYDQLEIPVDNQINDLTNQVKEAVLQVGSTVKGIGLMAVYSKGRVTWDGKKLEGMMALVPGLKAARSEGEPSVSIRKVG